MAGHTKDTRALNNCAEGLSLTGCARADCSSQQSQHMPVLLCCAFEQMDIFELFMETLGRSQFHIPLHFPGFWEVVGGWRSFSFSCFRHPQKQGFRMHGPEKQGTIYSVRDVNPTLCNIGWCGQPRGRRRPS